MKKTILFGFLAFMIMVLSCQSNKKNKKEKTDNNNFPSELVNFVPYNNNPVFSGTNSGTWDNQIRERGYILLEDSIYKMWYSGYNGGESDPKYLGYATSIDGIHWNRYPDNPVFNEKWTEDMFVIKHDDIYYMFAEGKKDIAHLLTSNDGIHWKEEGDLVLLKTNGDTIQGPYGTPSVWIENEKWHLFYERNDEGIWLAISGDKITWTNVQDDPILKMGPEEYDAGAVAANQVVKFNERYYIYYHGSTNPNWADPNENALWTSNVAMSTDLIHWEKYPGNPIVEGDHSSPILVCNGNDCRLYAMHDIIWLYFPK